jgi:hypothetical protein
MPLQNIESKRIQLSIDLGDMEDRVHHRPLQYLRWGLYTTLICCILFDLER